MPDAVVPPVIETPRLSPSIAKILLARSPLHAWQYHRLLGGTESAPTAATTDGRILESIIFDLNLTRGLPFNAYRSNEAKAARDAVLADGMIPVLESQWPEYAAAGLAMLAHLQAAGVDFSGGAHQKTILWTSEGVECKGVLDYLVVGENFYVIYDLKTVEDASADGLARAVGNYGWDIQAASYMEAVETKRPDLAGRGKYILAAVEKEAPFAANPRELSAAFQSIGRIKWAKAKGVWSRCLASNTWPSYEAGYIEPLPWQMKAAEGMMEESNA